MNSPITDASRMTAIRKLSPFFLIVCRVHGRADVEGFFLGRGSRGWLSQVLVDQLLEIAQRPDGALVVERQDLHHHDAADVLHGIDPELGVVDAGPAEAARAAELCVLRVA